MAYVHPLASGFKLKAVREPNAFTLIELLVVLAIVAVLAAIAVPVALAIQTQAKATKCLNQLRQIGLATRLYANDNNQILPFTSHQRSSWTNTLQPYSGGTITFLCPCDTNSRTFSYAINDYLTPNPAGDPTINFSILSRLEKPSETFLMTETADNYSNTDHFHFADYHGLVIPPDVFSDQVGVKRHGNGANYLFADAHVENLKWLQMQIILRTPGTRFVDPTAAVAN